MDQKAIAAYVRERICSSVRKRKPFILAANWKMNKTSYETRQYLEALSHYRFSRRNTVIIFPPSFYLPIFQENADPRIRYGPQNLYCERKGAFTGELSPWMARELGCSCCILGHSERRNLFHETDELIGRKVSACLKAGLHPVLCIGEHLEERRSESWKSVLCRQLERDLAGVDGAGAARIVIAYEPVWAIGTGESASPEQIEETHGAIRQELISLFGFAAGSGVPILYGGSAGPGNIGRISLCGNVSGFLIGTASLDVQKFIQMMDLVNEESQNPGETGSGEVYGIAR